MQRATSVETQCKHIGQHGQCKYEVVPDANKCYHHGGLPEKKAKDAASLSSYRLNLFQARLDQHIYDPNIKSLRGEIGILRMMIETRLNQCKDDYDLMLQSAAIAKLVTDANTLVTSCHRIETLTGQLLDKQQLAEFASGVVDIITQTCNPDQAEDISNKILNLMIEDTFARASSDEQ